MQLPLAATHLVQRSTLFGTEASVGTNDLLQDVAGALGSDVRLGVGVVMGDVVIDGSHEFGQAFEPTPAQAVLGDAPCQLGLLRLAPLKKRATRNLSLACKPKWIVGDT